MTGEKHFVKEYGPKCEVIDLFSSPFVYECEVRKLCCVALPSLNCCNPKFVAVFDVFILQIDPSDSFSEKFAKECLEFLAVDKEGPPVIVLVNGNKDEKLAEKFVPLAAFGSTL